MKIHTSVLLALLLAASPLIQAAEGNGKPPPPPNHFDPALCKGVAPGTVLEFKSPEGRTIKGTCQLVFLPDRPDHPDHPDCPADAPPPGGKQ